MKPEWKAKWIEALRSGAYQQAREELRRSDGAMCCLGVLRHIADPGDRTRNNDDEELLDSNQRALFNLSDKEQTHLASMNDTGSTFAEIADYIEAKL